MKCVQRDDEGASEFRTGISRGSKIDAACAQLEAAGVPLVADREAAWQGFIQAHMAYEEETAWLAAAISDPLPCWPAAPGRAGA